jgi:hypothetical protein
MRVSSRSAVQVQDPFRVKTAAEAACSRSIILQRERGMETVTLTLPQFLFIVGTRAMLGVGIGLLVSDKLNSSTRRTVGLALAAIGAATTIPAARLVFGQRTRALSAIDAPGT